MVVSGARSEPSDRVAVGVAWAVEFVFTFSPRSIAFHRVVDRVPTAFCVLGVLPGKETERRSGAWRGVMGGGWRMVGWRWKGVLAVLGEALLTRSVRRRTVRAIS